MPIDHRIGFGRTVQGIALTALVPLGIAGAPATQAQTAPEAVLIGVSGPLTGPQAQYGAQWKKGFDLHRVAASIISVQTVLASVSMPIVLLALAR
jgi:hypothetical protein